MTICKTRGLAIRKLDYSETSQIVTFLTEGYGKTKTIAKGIKRPKSRLGGAVDLLADCEVVFLEKPGGDLHILTECEATSIFAGLREDPERAEAAFAAADLLDRFVYPGERGKECYQLSVELLGALDRGEERAEILFLAFVARLLKIHGLLPLVGHCVACREARPARESMFSSRLGGLLCKRCLANDPYAFKTTAGSVALLAALAKPDRLPRRRLRMSETDLRNLWVLVARYLAFVLDGLPDIVERLRRRMCKQPDSAGVGQRIRSGASA
ncbi:MAG: DNA repair protein RecO [Planctomycetota bacterium]|nr:DNA repair protein RecO [Planctomycetota bacterium]